MSILDNVFKGIEMNNLYTRTYPLFTQQQNDANWKLNETKSVFKIILAKKWGKNKKVLKNRMCGATLCMVWLVLNIWLV